jgi:sulfur carrier protein ThiS
MKINLQVSDFLKRYIGDKKTIELTLKDNATVKDAISSVGIPTNEIGFIVLNGNKIDNELMLNEGDEIKVYNLIIGG